MNIYKTFDVVVVSFPFTDKRSSKNRPALVLSSPSLFNQVAEHTVLAMITSARHTPWPLDVEINDLDCCNLQKPSFIRFKLFTLDHALIRKQIGRLSPKDQEQLRPSLYFLFNEALGLQLEK